MPHDAPSLPVSSGTCADECGMLLFLGRRASGVRADVVPLPRRPAGFATDKLSACVLRCVADLLDVRSELGGLELGVRVSVRRIHADAQGDRDRVCLPHVRHARVGAVVLRAVAGGDLGSDVRDDVGPGGVEVLGRRLGDPCAWHRVREHACGSLGQVSVWQAVGCVYLCVGDEPSVCGCTHLCAGHCRLSSGFVCTTILGDPDAREVAGELGATLRRWRSVFLIADHRSGLGEALLCDDLRVRSALQGHLRRSHERVPAPRHCHEFAVCELRVAARSRPRVVPRQDVPSGLPRA
mmetsp:Transcript_12482/g.35753  ORF Transcript_12482/g.35753 Transcript_12482/m.35753 type:complete len:295 (-) Transcript_12482:179-1063(-)